MTAVIEKPAAPQGWNAMPGWGIVGDLTPPELINARRLYTLRRIIAGALAFVVVLCGAGYGYAMMKHSSASNDMSSAEAQTTELNVSAGKYSGITRIETKVNASNSQLASLMHIDVDVAKLLATIRANLPGSMSIDNVSLALVNPTLAAGSGATTMDTTGRAHIGTVTINGSAQTLNDLPAFVDQLAALPGVVDVLPTSDQRTASVAQFSVSLVLTDALYSHSFDHLNTGVK
jgi:hypothetical protein